VFVVGPPCVDTEPLELSTLVAPDWSPEASWPALDVCVFVPRVGRKTMKSAKIAPSA
jgi:hypothetical protein